MPEAGVAAPGVLVVDDEPAILALLQTALTAFGFRVWTAEGAAKGLEVFRSHRSEIHVALLDVRMPERDGPAMIAALRAEAPDLPFCFMSGFAGTYEAEQLMALGAAHIFPKPFRLDELVSRLRQLANANNVDPQGAPEGNS
jgi:DNA-binding NtrC family response regulator